LKRRRRRPGGPPCAASPRPRAGGAAEGLGPRPRPYLHAAGPSPAHARHCIVLGASRRGPGPRCHLPPTAYACRPRHAGAGMHGGVAALGPVLHRFPAGGPRPPLQSVLSRGGSAAATGGAALVGACLPRASRSSVNDLLGLSAGPCGDGPSHVGRGDAGRLPARGGSRSLRGVWGRCSGLPPPDVQQPWRLARRGLCKLRRMSAPGCLHATTTTWPTCLARPHAACARLPMQRRAAGGGRRRSLARRQTACRPCQAPATRARPVRGAALNPLSAATLGCKGCLLLFYTIAERPSSVMW
jgi:hypothetical protein